MIHRQNPDDPGWSAWYSDGECYRYLLEYTWGDPSYLAVWAMLNPSTATELKLDPTLTRCVNFTRREGLGGMIVVNRYAYRATKPAELNTVPDPVGPENHEVIRGVMAAESTAMVVVGWGATRVRTNGKPAPLIDAMAQDHDLDVLCLGKTGRGYPKHPLYVPANTPLVAFR